MQNVIALRGAFGNMALSSREECLRVVQLTL